MRTLRIATRKSPWPYGVEYVKAKFIKAPSTINH